VVLLLLKYKMTTSSFAKQPTLSPHLFHSGAGKIPHKINPKTKHKPLSKERPIKKAAGKGKEKKKKEKIMRERFTEKEIN
jgi:hypothetical protein